MRLRKLNVDKLMAKAKFTVTQSRCRAECRDGLLGKIKPYGFTVFAKRYGIEKLLDCLERNEVNGVVYHREGITGDYDDFTDVEELIRFILTGRK